MIELLKKCFSFPLQNKRYSICLILTLVLSYGFYACHYTVHIDQLVPEYYTGTYLINAGRWSAPIIHFFTNWMSFSPFWHTVVMGLFLFLAAIAWSVLFFTVSNGKLSETTLLVFSSLFVSYPVITAQLTYPILNIALCYVLVPFSLYFFVTAFFEQQRRMRHFILSLIVLIPAVDMYESFACVYLFGLFAILMLMYFYNDNVFKRKRNAIVFFMVAVSFLAAAIIIDFLLSKMLNYLLCGEFQFGYGPNTKIYWFSDHPLRIAKRLLMMMITQLLIGSLSLPFVFSFLVFGVIGLAVMIAAGIKKRSFFPVICYFGMCFSIVALSFLVGRMTPFRQMQALSVFVPFILMLIYRLIERKRIIKIVLSCILTIIVIGQTIDINHYAVDNYERHSYETALLQNVCMDLTEYDIQNKPVVFYADDYRLPKSLQRPRNGSHPVFNLYGTLMAPVFDRVLPKNYFKKIGGYGYPDTSEKIAEKVASDFPAYQSFIAWMSEYYSFYGYLSRLGYSFKVCSPEQKADATANASLNDPTCRYRIIESDDYILVQIMTID